MFKKPLLPFAILVLSQGVYAQQPPSAGSQIQQIPPAPTLQRAEPTIRIEPGTAPATPATDAVKITVNSLQVTGARAYPEAELLALTGFMPGSELTLADLNAMALKITDRYRSDGYFVAQAYLPAQEIQNGAVTIAVITAAYCLLLCAFAGGILMAFGAHLARGCTSGQALTGGALLNVGSWAFMLMVFVGGYAVAWFMRWQWR